MAVADSSIIRRETAISVAINMALSAAFFILVFGTRGPVPVWGVGGLAMDNLPQSFMVALMGGLVPSLLTRKRHRPSASLRSIALRSVTVAIGVVIIVGSVAALLLAATGAEVLPFAATLAAKVTLGGSTAFFVTKSALKKVLSAK